jgi:phosphotransferase system enzyme I (PtsI)
MAADRLSAELAGLTDAWQPAVLHLIAITASAGREAGKPVGVCGEAAADPLLACVLVGLGVTSLSMAVSAVRQVGAAVAGSSMQACIAAADAALHAGDPIEARAAATAALGH